MPTVVSTPEAAPPLPVFSQAVKSHQHVFVSGNIGLAGVKDHTNLVEGGVQPQTRAALKNLSIVLKAAGSDLKHVVKVNIYLTDLKRDFALMNEVYSEFFGKDALPARTCIGVSTLPLGAEVEIECVAELIPKSS